MRLFVWQHLPPHLQVISRQFADLAQELVNQLPDSPELSFCLRQLVLAKDAAVRCEVLWREDQAAMVAAEGWAKPTSTFGTSPSLTSANVYHGYTPHGYRCCSHAQYAEPQPAKARCGGPNLCAKCADAVNTLHQMPLPVIPTESVPQDDLGYCDEPGSKGITLHVKRPDCVNWVRQRGPQSRVVDSATLDEQR
jgi:hypothetical protein